MTTAMGTEPLSSAFSDLIADEEYYSREPLLARLHLRRMNPARRAQLEREWSDDTMLRAIPEIL